MPGDSGLRGSPAIFNSLQTYSIHRGTYGCLECVPIKLLRQVEGKRRAFRKFSPVALPPVRIADNSSISNNVGPVKSFSLMFCPFFSFFEHTAPFTPASGLVGFVDLCLDDHGSFVIFRSASVRPNHLFDQNIDHDYFFKLPFRGARCPIKCTTLLLHAMGGFGLSRVRTELERWRIVTSVPPHPVQPSCHPPTHRYLGNALVSTHCQVNVATAPFRVDTCRRLSRFYQQETQQRIALLADMS